MVPCLTIGDELALGLPQGRPDCVAVAAPGITSAALDLGHLKSAQTAIISLAANDAPGAETVTNLQRLRQAVTAERVIWLMPNALPAVRLAVTTVAAEWGDGLIDTRPPLPGQAPAQPPRASTATAATAPTPTPTLHRATAADREAALLACGSSVDPSTLQAIMRVESGGRPFAINVNAAPAKPPPAATATEAAAEAQAWIARGYSVDLGLMQVNSRNLPSLGFTVAEMFDPCANIQAGASILTADYLAASSGRPNPQDALKAALSAYNTGSFERGFYNGYVAKYYGPGAEVGDVPIITAAAYHPHRAALALPPNPFTASPDVYSRESSNE